MLELRSFKWYVILRFNCENFLKKNSHEKVDIGEGYCCRFFSYSLIVSSEERRRKIHLTKTMCVACIRRWAFLWSITLEIMYKKIFAHFLLHDKVIQGKDVLLFISNWMDDYHCYFVVLCASQKSHKSSTRSS